MLGNLTGVQLLILKTRTWNRIIHYWLCWGRRQCDWGRSRASPLPSPDETDDPGKASAGSGRRFLTTSGPSETWFTQHTCIVITDPQTQQCIFVEVWLTLASRWWYPVWPTGGRDGHFAPPENRKQVFFFLVFLLFLQDNNKLLCVRV